MELRQDCAQHCGGLIEAALPALRMELRQDCAQHCGGLIEAALPFCASFADQREGR